LPSPLPSALFWHVRRLGRLGYRHTPSKVERGSFPIPSNNLRLIASVILDEWIQLGDTPSVKIPTHLETSSHPDATFPRFWPSEVVELSGVSAASRIFVASDVFSLFNGDKRRDDDLTASLDLPITRVEEPDASLVAGLHTSMPGAEFAPGWSRLG
jgi:hypothetical protein